MTVADSQPRAGSRQIQSAQSRRGTNGIMCVEKGTFPSVAEQDGGAGLLVELQHRESAQSISPLPTRTGHRPGPGSELLPSSRKIPRRIPADKAQQAALAAKSREVREENMCMESCSAAVEPGQRAGGEDFKEKIGIYKV